jgi:hypothetical protein
MKYLNSTIIFIISLNCFGQTKENFLNSVFKVFVDTSFTKYHLFSDANGLSIGKYDKLVLIKDLSEFISIETINELISKSGTDTLKLTWDCKSLDLANCVENSKGILFDNFVVQTKRRSKRKQEKEMDKQIVQQNDGFQNKPRQERIMYSFSRPIFDNKNEYAIISMWESCGNTCGQGCIYLFKKNNGVWQSVTTTNCKLS